MPTGDHLRALRDLAEEWRQQHYLETGHAVWLHTRRFDFATACWTCANTESARQRQLVLF